MAEVSKEKTDKKDEDVAAKNKDLQTLRGEVGYPLSAMHTPWWYIKAVYQDQS